MRVAVALIVACVLLTSPPACADPTSAPSGGAAGVESPELLVFAAASLTDVLQELGRTWTARSNVRIAFSFGASSDLARQIKAGAPADVFFSADTLRMEELELAGLVDGRDRREVLSNVLVVVTPKRAPATISAPGDLAKVTKLALANPDAVPAGRYAKRYLEAQHLWDTVADKIVPTLDVRAALAAVASEHADAGIVYRTDAAMSGDVRVAFEISPSAGPPIAYPIAPLRRAPAAARELVDFLASADAAPVYERFGFIMLRRK